MARLISLIVSLTLMAVVLGAAKPKPSAKHPATTSAASKPTTHPKWQPTSGPVRTGNLLFNPGMEGSSGNKLPEGWESMVIGAPAEITVDRAEKHGAGQSIRLSAKEITRVYVCSQWFPVAPGERIHAGAWIKVKDIPPEKGTVIVIAEYSPGSEDGEDVAKVDIAKVKGDIAKDWQHVDGVVTVPAMITRMRLRIGMSYSMGTIWCDDAYATAEAPLVVRCEALRGRITAADAALNVSIVNRNHAKGLVQVRVQMKDANSALELPLTGELVQPVKMPARDWPRGNGELDVSLLTFGSKEPLFKEERDVLVPYAMTLSPPIPTHWAVEDGPPRIGGDIDLELGDRQREDGTLQVRLLSRKKQLISSWSGDPKQGWTHFDLPPTELPVGTYTMVGEFIPRRGAPIKLERVFTIIPRRLARVTLNSGGYPEYDGKAIFPMGIFNGGRMEEMGKAGFTVAHAYNAVRIAPGQPAEDNRALEFLETSEKAGMKCLFMVPLRLAYKGDWEGFRRRIRMFRNHPALLAWDEEESIARGECPAAVVEKMRQIVSEEDPNHPFMIGDSRDIIFRITDRSNFFPLASMDMGMWWWYPFPLEARKGAALEGEEANKGTELEGPSFLLQRNTNKPIWVGIQSYRKNAKSRFPTSQEYRAQAYASVIYGAQGLMWYGGHVEGGIFTLEKDGKPDEHGVSNDKAAHWDYLQKLATELRGMSDLFMAPSEAASKVLPEGTKIIACIKRLGARRMMLSVNRSEQPVEATFAIPGMTRGKADVMFEGRSVEVNGGVMKDKFEPLGVHVYNLDGSAAAEPGRAGARPSNSGH